MGFACVLSLIALHRAIVTGMLPQTIIVWIGMSWAFATMEVFLVLTKKERAPSMRRGLALFYGSVITAVVFGLSWLLPVEETWWLAPVVSVLGITHVSASLPMAIFGHT